MKKLFLSLLLLLTPSEAKDAYAGGIPVIDSSNLAQNVMTTLHTLKSTINEAVIGLYPEFNKELKEVLPKEAIASLDEALSESRRMMKGAARTGASVLESLPRSTNDLDRLLVNSGNAIGILQAAQAGNQIAANVASNLMNLNAVTAPSAL